MSTKSEPDALIAKLVTQATTAVGLTPPDDPDTREKLPHVWALLWTPIRNEHGQLISGARLSYQPVTGGYLVTLTHQGLSMAASAPGNTMPGALENLNRGLGDGTIPMTPFRTRVRLKAPKAPVGEVPNQARSEGRRR